MNYVELLAACDKKQDEINAMRHVVEAAQRLVTCKGRHHSELNYKQLEEALVTLKRTTKETT